MIRRVSTLMVLLLLGLSLYGCWDYRGLDKISIVTGMAVDYDFEEEVYNLTFEIVDLNSTGKDEGNKSFTLESRGVSIFDSVRNAKQKVPDKLYFATAQTIILSYDYVAQMGLFPVLDWFLRDAECRGTSILVISEGVSAADIISTKLGENNNLSMDLNEIISEDNKVSLSTVSREVFEVYNTLEERDKGISITLPMVGLVQNGEDVVVKTTGVAIFKEDRAVGRMGSEDAKYFLFAVDSVKGGLLTYTLPTNGPEGLPSINNITLEIKESTTKKKVEVEDGMITLKLDIETDVFIGQLNERLDLFDENTVDTIRLASEEFLSRRVRENVLKYQMAYNTDIYGIGNTIYRKNYREWQNVADTWDTLYPKIEIEVESQINILNSGFVNLGG